VLVLCCALHHQLPILKSAYLPFPPREEGDLIFSACLLYIQYMCMYVLFIVYGPNN
jgi:hypothetical protein